MSGNVDDRDVKQQAAVNPAKLNNTDIIRFPGPAVGATDGATDVGASVLNFTDGINSGSLSLTAGTFDSAVPDGANPRDLKLFLKGGTGTFVDSSKVELTFQRASGHEVTRKITGPGYTSGATGQVAFNFPYSVGKLLSGVVTATGNTLADLEFGIGLGAKLGLPNPGGKNTEILAEHGQSSAPSMTAAEKREGLFTPGTTLNGSTDVTVRVFTGNRRRA